MKAFIAVLALIPDVMPRSGFGVAFAFFLGLALSAEASDSLRVPVRPIDRFELGKKAVALRGISPVSAYELPPSVWLYRLVVKPEDAESEIGGNPMQPSGGYGYAIRPSGSIRRSVLAGNRRDVSVESGLNLDLSGKLTEDVEIRAHLSDRDIPIQPEGTTARIQELDRLYLELRAPPGTARMGDFMLEVGKSTALSGLKRKVQGVALKSRSLEVADGTTANVLAAGAIARGRYRMQEIHARDGMQGPYRLTGAHGEAYIIVIAGSERVYLDGALLTRGEENDYVIDYATAEITFTLRRPITAERRIRVEFEYTAVQYVRSLLAAEASVAHGAKWHLFGRVIREADGASLLEDRLDPDARRALETSLQGEVFVSGARRVPFQPEAPYTQYVLRDTVWNGQSLSYFAAVTAPVDSVYRVSFTFVGPGQGSYRQAALTEMGIGYRWVGPGNGEYEPGIRVQAPQALQVAHVGAALEPHPWLRMEGSWAASTYQANRLSGRLETAPAYEGAVLFQPDSFFIGGIGQMGLTLRAERKMLGMGFRGFERLRPIEQGRRWQWYDLDVGDPAVGLGEVEQAFEVQAGIRERMKGRFRYESLHVQGRGEARATDGRWYLHLPRALRLSHSWRAVRHTGVDGSGLASRHTVAVEHPLLQIKTTSENNRSHTENSLTDSLETYTFTEVTISAGKPAGEGAGIQVSHRWERRPWREEKPELAFRQLGIDAFGRIRWQQLSLRGSLFYRKKRFTPHFRSAGNPDRQSTGIQVRSRLQEDRLGLRLITTYEAASEQVARLLPVFVRTGQAYGQYVWVDANGDGIRQVDEFFPETTDFEGIYTRILLPTRELEPASRAGLRFHLTFSPPDSIGFPAFLHGATSSTYLTITEQNTWPRASDVYLFRPRAFRNTHTLRGHLRFSQEIVLPHVLPRISLRPRYRYAHLVQTLAYGFEETKTREWNLSAGYRLLRKLELRLELQRRRKSSYNERFVSRTYAFLRQEATLAVVARPAPGSSISAGISRITGRLEGHASPLRGWVLPIEGNLQTGPRWYLAGSLHLRYQQGNLSARTWSGYELTDGSGPGTSIRWNALLRYRTGARTELQFIYQGRTSRQLPPVHTLRMEFSLLF